MFELTKTSIAVAAKQLANQLGIVAMIHMKACTIGRQFADCANAILGHEHLFVGAWRQSKSPAQVAICMSGSVLSNPLTLVSRVLTWVTLAVFGLNFDRTRFAFVAKPVCVSLVRTEGRLWQQLFTNAAFLHAVWRYWARVWNVISFLSRDKARLAIRREAILFLRVCVECSRRFRKLTSKANLIHDMLHDLTVPPLYGSSVKCQDICRGNVCLVGLTG